MPGRIDTPRHILSRGYLAVPQARGAATATEERHRLKETATTLTATRKVVPRPDDDGLIFAGPGDPKAAQARGRRPIGELVATTPAVTWSQA